MVDIHSLLQPVTSDSPGGPNLEYTAEYAELERDILGKPERQIGETIVAAEGPDWQSVVEKATALLRSSKDLRVATQLARALLKTGGFEGFAEGLELVRGLVDRYWPVFHPRLDEEDNDPTSRINAMAALTHRDMLHAVRAAPLLKSKAFGIVTLRNFEGPAPQGDVSAGGGPTEAALDAMPIADLEQAAGAVGRCDQAARDIEMIWASHLEGAGPDFGELRQVLARATKIVKGRLDERLAAAGDRAATESAEAALGDGPPAPRGELRSREDVVRALDGICAYYARHEPSSPVPLLLERCKRLVTMSFLDIVKDMLPDGLSTIQTITGKPGG
jgi:type VI secretion system protein ImpA